MIWARSIQSIQIRMPFLLSSSAVPWFEPYLYNVFKYEGVSCYPHYVCCVMIWAIATRSIQIRRSFLTSSHREIKNLWIVFILIRINPYNCTSSPQYVMGYRRMLESMAIYRDQHQPFGSRKYILQWQTLWETLYQEGRMKKLHKDFAKLRPGLSSHTRKTPGQSHSSWCMTMPETYAVKVI